MGGDTERISNKERPMSNVEVCAELTILELLITDFEFTTHIIIANGAANIWLKSEDFTDFRSKSVSTQARAQDLNQALMVEHLD